MEVEFPWKPTPCCQRKPAIDAYVEGEKLCEQGELAAGVKKLREAVRLAWELERETWPGWAYALHAEATGVDYKPNPAILVAHDVSVWQPTLAALPRSGIDWFLRQEALGAIDAALRKQCVAIVDGLCGAELCGLARDECELASQDGTLKPAHVATPASGPTGEQGPQTRSDRMTWADSKDARWTAVTQISRRIDSLVVAARAYGLSGAGASGAGDGPLDDVRGRERVMVAAYGHGDAFARHSDNHCNRGKGVHCNPRVLSAVYYMSPQDWRPGEDGGSLRIYKSPLEAEGSNIGRGKAEREEEDGDDGNDVKVEISPVPDRLVLFMADLRCPHEVLPVLNAERERYSAITWYGSGEGGTTVSLVTL